MNTPKSLIMRLEGFLGLEDIRPYLDEAASFATELYQSGYTGYANRIMDKLEWSRSTRHT